MVVYIGMLEAKEHQQGTVTPSIAKVFLGSAKTRWAILMERLTSFWA